MCTVLCLKTNVFVHVHAYILGSLEYFKTSYLIKVEMYIYPHHI